MSTPNSTGTNHCPTWCTEDQPFDNDMIIHATPMTTAAGAHFSLARATYLDGSPAGEPDHLLFGRVPDQLDRAQVAELIAVLKVAHSRMDQHHRRTGSRG